MTGSHKGLPKGSPPYSQVTCTAPWHYINYDREQYHVTLEDKAAVLGVVQLQSLELMALNPEGWAAIWEGFKSRFAELFQQVAGEHEQNP